jgi:hypothetical protein
MAPRETIPGFKEVLAEMTLGQCPLWTWVPVIEIPHKLNLGLVVLHAHDTSVGFEMPCTKTG